MTASPTHVAPRELDPDGVSGVETALVEHVERRGRALVEVDASLHEVVTRVRGLLRGGKRLRASFCLWGARAAAGSHDEVPGAPQAAAALEMFHLAALVHDDVMDRSEQRRGLPTVHHAFAERHRDEAHDGDARTFGDGVAVLAGDLCLTWSDDLMHAALLATGPHHPDRARDARRVWEEMRDQVLAGQYLDLLAQARPGTGSAAASLVLTYKSAKYTVEHPLLLGATLGGADPALLHQLSLFGLAVGEAFQLRDDVLGVFGDPARTGKPVSDDVREGKRTLLVTHAEEAGTAPQRRVLGEHLGDPHGGPAGLHAVREVIVATGSLAAVEERITRRMAEARDVLADMSVDERTRHTLSALSDACAWRAA